MKISFNARPLEAPRNICGSCNDSRCGCVDVDITVGFLLRQKIAETLGGLQVWILKNDLWGDILEVGESHESFKQKRTHRPQQVKFRKFMPTCP